MKHCASILKKDTLNLISACWVFCYGNICHRDEFFSEPCTAIVSKIKFFIECMYMPLDVMYII